MWSPIKMLGYCILAAVGIIEIIGAESGMLTNGLAWIDYGTHCNIEWPGLNALSVSEMIRHVNPGEDD